MFINEIAIPQPRTIVFTLRKGTLIGLQLFLLNGRKFIITECVIVDLSVYFVVYICPNHWTLPLGVSSAPLSVLDAPRGPVWWFSYWPKLPFCRVAVNKHKIKVTPHTIKVASCKIKVKPYEKSHIRNHSNTREFHQYWRRRWWGTF